MNVARVYLFELYSKKLRRRFGAAEQKTLRSAMELLLTPTVFVGSFLTLIRNNSGDRSSLFPLLPASVQ
ncbi:hypothetical protein D918_07871 [Trichuris suis]|nr:hypothetical protein D918_07871 [Trichuris suis]